MAIGITRYPAIQFHNLTCSI